MLNVLPPIASHHKHHPHHRLPEPAIVQPRGSSPPPPPAQPQVQPPQPPQQPPVLPPQQRAAPVPDVKERVTVNGIPSQTVVDGKLVIGHDRSTSVRSYTPLKNVGDGSFGTVVLADWHSPLPPGVSISPMQLNIKFNSSSSSTPLRMVAIKRMKKKWQGGWAECSQLKELESLRRISPHPNIIPLYDSFLLPETKELYFIFECMEGNLYQLIKSRKGRPLAGGLVASIYRQVVEGLRHIHDSGYFHRDMKPENLLVTTTGLADYSPTSPRVASPHTAPPEKDVMVIVKLADFGLAREVNSTPPYTEYVSTRWYRAPEVLLRSTNYNKPVDMWALGTILAELVNLKPIFPGQTEMDQVQKIVDILGNPTTNGEYGVDDRARVHPYPFHKLFDRNVPPSLIDCIADLIRYDPERRLTAQQCKDHPYWKETENTQRGTIATQPQAPHDRQSSSRQQQQQQPRQAEQQRQPNAAGEPSRKKPSHITVPHPPDTNASSTSSNKSLRAAVAGMGLYGGPSQQQQQPQPQQQQAGFTPGHARSQSTNHAGPSGLGLPAMSPRDIPPSHSHPHSSGKLRPFNAAGHDVVPPLPPLSVPSSHPEGASTSSSAATSVPYNHSHHAPSLNHSLSNANLNVNLSVHRQHGQDQMLSPISPSASPGLFSPISQAGDISPGPDVSMSLGAMQYQQASAAHYAGDRAYTGRSYGSQPGTAATSKSAELVARMGELDLPPPVPPLPWNAGGAPGPTDEDQMEISRGSLELPPIQEQPSHPIPIKQQQYTASPVQMTAPAPQPQVPAPAPQPQQPPQPAPVQQSSGSKFGLGIFGKKSRFGLFKHSDSNSNSIDKAAATVSSTKPADAQMAASNSAPAVPSIAHPGNSLKRGPSDSAGSINELQAAAAAAAAAPAPARPLDRKAEKKMLAKMRQEEQRAQYEARARRQKESSRAVIRKREEVIERKGVKEFEWETTTATLVGSHEPPAVDKGKGVLRPQPSNLTTALGLSNTNERTTVEASNSSKTLVEPLSQLQHPQPQPHQYPQPTQQQYLSTHQYELQNHLHRHKARRRDADDDHSMSSSDVHSVSRFSAISRSTVDSDPGPGRHRMPMPGSSKRGGTIGPYPAAGSSNGINRATSVSNLRAGPGPSSFSRGFSPSARSSTSLEQPFIAEFDELGFHQDGRGPFRGDPNGAAAGSFTGPSEMHAGMGVTMVSPPMQMLSLAGSNDPRGSQASDGQLPPHKYRSQTGSRGRHPPPSFLGMPSLPPISSVHSPTNSTSHELPELDPSGDGSSNGATYLPGPSESNQSFHLAESSSGNPNGQTLPPFRDIASWADQAPPG
ncbi:hypothetical protein FRC04_005316 [Tulasnella sp. 424]|nr:hypothetical protein FRC04_005316 [Tulasnella sp. 424]KAG8976426.1 hypothetical protein FRC05_003669 [Tulasnella sp. 425]